jgi:predicted NBD/HSP70 family sugar kinase
MVSNFRFLNTLSAKHQVLINKSIILNYLRENFSVSRAKIAIDLKISPPTVSKIIDEFISEGFVIEMGKDLSTGGKKATKLGFNTKNGSVIGVDLGKDRIRIARSDLGGQILEKHVGFEIYYKDKDLLEKITKEIQMFINGIDSNTVGNNIDLKGICVGIPADIDSESGKVLSSSLFADWQDLNLKEIFSKYFNIKIFIENSKDMSAIGEKYLGGGKHYKDFVMLEVGEGIGAGIIIDDQLYKGSSFSAGEVGFFIENKKQLYSTYKIKGSMEKSASPNILKRDIMKIIESNKKTLVTELVGNDLSKINPSIVCKAALLGDKASKKIIKNVVENLSIIVLNLVLVLNPEIIVIGGDILEFPEVGRLFINPIKELIKNIVPFRLPVIKIASLGVDAGVLGCSIFAINNILGTLYPYKI